MKISWTKGLNKDQKSEIERDFKASLLLRKRLALVCQSKIDESNSSSRSKSAYESPNWAYVQADARGYERALEDVISLITDESVEKIVKNQS